MKQRFGLKVGDIILMAAILLIALGLFLLPFLSKQGTQAELLIAETGERRVISLEEKADYEIVSRGIHLTVSVAGGEIFVSQADCPDHVCSNTPAISRPGQSIVCVPAGVVIRILGEGAAVDAVAG